MTDDSGADDSAPRDGGQAAHDQPEAGTPEPPDATDEVTAVTEAGGTKTVTPTAGTTGDETAASGATDEAAAPAPTRRRRGGRLHATLIGVLVVLSCLAVVITGVAWWAHYTTLNTDGYMRLVGPIGKDPAAIQSLSEYVTTQIVTATDLQARAQEALPERAQFLAGPITAQVETFIQKQTYKILSTDKAYEIWLKVTRLSHEKVVGLLRGENTLTYIQGDDVKLDVLPLVSQALVRLDDRLPGALSSRFSPPVIEPGTPPDEAIQQVSEWSGRPLPPDFGQITLLESDSLGIAQTAIKVFDSLMWILPVVAAVLIALTIWLSHRRRTTIIVLGIGVAVALIITNVIVKRGTEAILEGLQAGTAKTLVSDVVRASLGPLTTLTVWVVVIAAVVAVVAWIVGRRDLRVALVNAGRATAVRADEVATSDAPAILWARRNAAWVRLAGLVGLLLLLVLWAASWTWIIVLLILLALYEVAVSYIVGEWPFPERAPKAAAD